MEMVRLLESWGMKERMELTNQTTAGWPGQTETQVEVAPGSDYGWFARATCQVAQQNRLHQLKEVTTINYSMAKQQKSGLELFHGPGMPRKNIFSAK